MASASGTKRIKMTAGQSSRAQKRKEKFYSNTFLTKQHEKHFTSIQNRRLLMERTVNLKPGEVLDFLEEFSRRRWNILGTYPEPATIAIVKEFYANARIFSESDIPFMSYVRGKRIPYDDDTINSFLETEWNGGDTLCQYAHLLEEVVDYQAIERAICRPGGTFRCNRQGQPVHIRRSDLTPLSKLWMMLMLSNIFPCSHVSDLTVSRSLTLSCILTRKTINLGSLISKEIHQCAHTAGPKAPLGHPSLVTHLCQLAGVDVSTPPFERPRKTIDFSFYMQYCIPDDDGPVAPPPPLPARHRARPPTETQFDLLPYLTSLHRGQLATSRMLRELTNAMPTLNMMSAAEFDEYVAWPGDQSHSIGGGGVAADDDTDEDEQEEEDDDSEESDDSTS
ncbi:hypothetical protein LR48_Vigan10g053500 [Vigna angularis]|uniref:Putative plant transposon protein domain-containing protein n=1 Tax=Phaseolus angularis TaxID=3914 RepID=A0A0L9VI32_PHAAN|nr:hypothetical protein LR48_Vigan10g053500 [Vigna angularis]